MKINQLLITLSLCSSALFMTGCCKQSDGGKPSRKSQEVTFNIQGDPFCLDPRKARRLNDLNLLKTFNDGLYRTDKEGKVTEAIVKTATLSDDKKTYTFELKETLWCNGDPLTAHDFIYSWKSSLSKDFPSPYATALYPLKNAKAIKEGLMPTSMLGAYAKDDYTLVVELEEQTPFFTELLTLPVYFAVNQTTVEEDSNWHLHPEKFVSNGPFTLEKWTHKDEIVASRNDRYWDKGAVRLSKLHMLMVDPDTAFKMYENGELDWAGSPYSNLPPDVVGQLSDTDLIIRTPALCTYMLKTNIEAYPFNNKNFRKALSLAINRKDIVKHVLYEGAEVATSLVPKCLGLTESEYFEDGNSQKAQEYFEKALTELSLTRSTFPKITITYNASEKSHKIISAVQDQLKSLLGIDVLLEPLEGKVCIDKLARGNYQVVFRDWTADFSDPINFLEVFKTKAVGTNNTGWESLDYISAIEASYTCDSQDERTQVLTSAEKIFMDDLPAIPLYHVKLMHLQDEKLKDVVLTETGNIDFKWAYVAD